MKDGLAQIVGKQITAVLVAANQRAPRLQVFLVFSDGTSFEFYGESFTCCAGLDRAAGIPHSIASSGARVVQVRTNAQPNESSLETLLSRDLDAWQAAKMAIARAKGG